jgi:hypothetical protein
MYKSKVKNAQIIFEKNKLTARIEMMDGSSEQACYDIDLGTPVDLPAILPFIAKSY